MKQVLCPPRAVHECVCGGHVSTGFGGILGLVHLGTSYSLLFGLSARLGRRWLSYKAGSIVRNDYSSSPVYSSYSNPSWTLSQALCSTQEIQRHRRCLVVVVISRLPTSGISSAGTSRLATANFVESSKILETARHRRVLFLVYHVAHHTLPPLD